MNLVAESRIVRWFLKPASAPSVFEESRASGWILKVLSRLGVPRLFQSEKTAPAFGEWILLTVLFASIFLPRFDVGVIREYFPIVLRTEDLLLVLLALAFFSGIWKQDVMAIGRIEKAFLAFLVVAGISVFQGLWLRTVDKPLLSLFYLLKWFEYFLLFAAAARIAAALPHARHLLMGFFLLGIAIALYGYWEFMMPVSKAVYPNYYRLFERAPFHGDANHIGGLLVLWMGFFTGFFLYAQKRSEQGILLAALLFVFFPLIWTYSRKSYFALAGSMLFSLIFKGTRKRSLLLISLLILFGLAFPTRLSERLLELGEAFRSSDPFHSSWAGNLTMWRESLWNFQNLFLLGSGWASRHRLFYESQYVLVLAETGVVGFTFFAALLIAPLREVTLRFRHPLPQALKAMAAGWLIGFVGLLIHNASCISFTIVKIAMPYWILTAAVVAHLNPTKRSE